MTIKEVAELLDAEVVCGDEYLDETVCSACGSDLMSDVLAYVKDQAVLLTGLVNQQTIRTADMMDMKCVVFVRGKRPDDAVIKLAQDMDMVALCTCKRMFEACGMLYENGLGAKRRRNL